MAARVLNVAPGSNADYCITEDDFADAILGGPVVPAVVEPPTDLTLDVHAAGTDDAQEPTDDEAEADDFEEDDVPPPPTPAASDVRVRVAGKRGATSALVVATPACGGAGYTCDLCAEFFRWDDSVNKAVNHGNARYPRYRDSGCSNAARRLAGACETPDEKKAHRKLMADRDQYRLKIMQLKHQHIANSHQREFARKLVETIVAFTALKEKTAIAMLDRDGFISYHKFFRNKSEEIATTLWDSESENKDVLSEIVEASFTYQHKYSNSHSSHCTVINYDKHA